MLPEALANLIDFRIRYEINDRILSPYGARLQALDSSDFRTRTAKKNS